MRHDEAKQEDRKGEKREGEGKIDEEKKEDTKREQVLSKTLTEVDESKFLTSSFDVDPRAFHSFHKCRNQRCSSLSSDETSHQKESVDRFQHSWIMDEKLSCSTATDVNWLIYVEGQGMFCMLCRKHGTSNCQNKSKKYNLEPALRFKRKAVEEHANTQQHKAAVEGEIISRVSSFEAEIQDIQNTKDEVLYKTFLAMYWLAKEELPNKKFVSLLSMLEQIGIQNVKYFKHRSTGSIREMFLLIGSVLKEKLTKNLSMANSNI